MPQIKVLSFSKMLKLNKLFLLFGFSCYFVGGGGSDFLLEL
jgi:hypothetical protein